MYCEKCGKDSGKYPLCKDCYYEQFEDECDDEIYEDFDEFNYAGECLLCGNEKLDADHIFCTECFKLYRNKEVLVSIINGKDVKLLESHYYSKYRCIDGHYVKSKSEREIDNYLDKNHIRHYYEHEVSLDGSKENTIHPDFYLPDIDVYIEHWGMQDDAYYNESMNHKLEIYKKLKLTLICTYENSDSADIESALNRKLKFYKKHQINYLEDTPPFIDSLPF